MGAPEPPRDPLPARFVVGIDLGTTNSALAFADTQKPGNRIQDFKTPQLIAPGEVESREVLPSFLYQPAPGEFAAGSLRLPWSGSVDANLIVGAFAWHQRGAVPGRVIQSAKSWLCHAGVDRTADLLPWQTTEAVQKLSPVAASAAILAHFRSAWDCAHPQHPLAQQDVVLTLPASFDEVARELTLSAARQAGLPRVVLLEEPQAAFYAWLDRHADSWQQQIAPGQKILVCDIGGGTSDFTLIRARGGESGRVQFHRVAVGPHLMLGGDNLDLALAKALESRLSPSGPLEPRLWSQLLLQARRLKELFLGSQPPDLHTVSVSGGGSRLIGGARQTEVTRHEVEELLLNGFLPLTGLNERPATRRSGFQEFGLPFAADPAISKYLAQFLTQHAYTGDAETERRESSQISRDDASALTLAARPDVLLLNGGFFASTQLKARLIELLKSWFDRPQHAWQPLVLDNPRLDLAVARGAAYFGLVRRGLGVSISSSLARSYYLGIALPPQPKAAPRAEVPFESINDGPTIPTPSDTLQAICLIPGQTEPGQQIELDSPKFLLQLRTPVEFPLYVSSARLADPAGTVLPFDPDLMTQLPPLRTVIEHGPKAGEATSLPVTLFGALTEIGTLELGCKEVSGNRRWRLQFDIRSALESDRVATQSAAAAEGIVDEGVLEALQTVLAETFVPGGPAPSGLVKRLENMAGQSKQHWPASLLRRLWEALLPLEAGRALSPEHEARWLYLVGYCLRPGCGLALDDWRVDQTRRLLWDKKLRHPALSSQTELLVLWRRVAAGLSAGQQRTLAEPLLASTQGVGKRRGAGTSLEHSPALLTERIRLLGAFECLPADWKQRVGNDLLQRVGKENVTAVQEAAWWALARLGTRQPFFGPLNTLVSADLVADWLRQLVRIAPGPSGVSPGLMFAVMQVSRRCDDRYRDVDDGTRQLVLSWQRQVGAPAHHLRLVEAGGELETAEQTTLLGENLPLGLRVLST